MADYRFSAQIIGRRSGRSATAAAAYRAGVRIVDERTGLVHDYTRKQGVLHAEIITPADTPSWMQDRSQLWNGVEAAERRSDAQLAREIQLSLPHELNHEQRLKLVRRFVQEQFVHRGMIADVAIHAPSAHEMADERNVHAHVMLTTRELLGDGFGNKNRDWNQKDVLENWREQWADHQNRELKRHGHAGRVSHETLEKQGKLREPQTHLGPIATEIERDGRKSHRGNENRAIDRRNGLRADLETAENVIDKKIEFEQRKFAVWADRKREKLQFDEKQRRAQFDVGFAARMAELEKQLEAEYGRDKEELARSHEQVAGRLEVTGWRKFVRDITLTSRRDEKELERLEAEQAEVRKAEQARLDQQAEFEARRRENIDRAEAQRAEALEKGIQKGQERREATDWAPLPSDWKEASRRPKPSVKEQFNEAAQVPEKEARAETGETDGKDKPPAPEPVQEDPQKTHKDAYEAKRDQMQADIESRNQAQEQDRSQDTGSRDISNDNGRDR